jgi:hypothetical protein
MPEFVPRKWRTKDEAPLPPQRQLQTDDRVKNIHGGTLRLDGGFYSWMFNVTTPELLEESIDKLFTEHPDATYAWLGNIVLVNIDPRPRPSGIVLAPNLGPVPPVRPPGLPA